jgi:metal-sulfur cluster biosynthetic enzyme
MDIPVAADSIRESLREVIDPEIGINIVDLGLIYEIELTPTPDAEAQDVTVTMTLTTPGCPAGPHILQEVKGAVERLAGVNSLELDLTFSPMWNEEMMSEDVRWILGR